MRVISVAAQLGNGKDVLCDYLATALNDRGNTGTWERSAFANAVKKVFMDSFGVDWKFIEKWKRIDEAPPPFLKNVRKSLQFIGDGFRQIQGDIWIDIALRDETRQMVISDSRYINESKAVKKKNGFTMVLWRPGWENDDPNPSEAQILPIVQACVNTQKEGKIDPSLCPDVPDLQYYDYFLKNEGSLADLYKKIDDVVVPHIEWYFADDTQIGEVERL